MAAGGDYATPGDRVHAVEVTTVVRWCALARRAHRGGAVMGEHAAAVRARRRWRVRPARGMVERETCRSHNKADGKQSHGDA
jgi:hypothetical protein